MMEGVREARDGDGFVVTETDGSLVNNGVSLGRVLLWKLWLCGVDVGEAQISPLVIGERTSKSSEC